MGEKIEPRFTPQEIKNFLTELDLERQAEAEVGNKEQADHLGGVIERSQTSSADTQQYYETMGDVEIK